MPEVYAPTDEEDDKAAIPGDVADSDLIAAAEAAARGEEPPKPEEKGRDEQGRFVKQEAKPAEAPKPKEAAKEKPSSIIARELAKREAARADKGQYEARMAEAERLHTQAQQLFQQIQQDREALAREKAEIAEARRNPAAFIAKQGWKADEFIDIATRSKDPIYQETVSLREQLHQTHSVINELRQEVLGLKAKAAGYDKQTEQAQRQAELDSFWAAIPDDSPVWQDFEDKDDIVYQAQKVRQRYFDQTKKVATPQEVAQYLHYKALQKRDPASAQTAAKPNAGKTRAKVPRALGGSDASERRPGNGAKHIHDMSADEERQYLMDVGTAVLTGGSD